VRLPVAALSQPIPGLLIMANLTEEQLAHLADLLARRDRELREDLLREADIKDSYIDVATNISDPGDASFADLSVDLENAAIGRDVAELRAIHAARGRMNNGTYGDCIECGTEIPYERLEVQPTADRCAPCQNMYEKTHADNPRGISM
jgi:RNA polymerase-binding transcription factor DksA